MKKFASQMLLVVALGCVFATLSAAQQSLGDAARAARKNKPSEPTTKVITNDDFGRPWVSLNPDSDNTAAKSDSDKDKNKEQDQQKEKKKTSVEEQAELDKQ